MKKKKRYWLVGLACLGALALPAAAGEASGDYRAWLGVLLGDAVDGGVELLALVPESPAERAGLRRGDIVIQAGVLPLAEVSDLTQVLEAHRPGDVLSLELLRSGERIRKQVELGSRRLTPLPETPPPPPPPASPAPSLAPSAEGCRRYGFAVADVTPDLRRHYGAPADHGVLVIRLDPDRPAQAAGFRVGDVLVQLGQEPIEQAAEVERLLDGRGEAAPVRASLIRDGQPTLITLLSPREERVETPVAPVAQPTERASGALERALELEIERLQRRLEELEQKLMALRQR